MKVGVISDWHLGYAFFDDERKNDSFENTRRAFEECVKLQPEVILLPGDLFDNHIPSLEVWHGFFELANQIKPLLKKSQSLKVEVFDRFDKKLFEKTFQDEIPLIAIHGTHEYRSKDYKNPLEILSASNFCIHLHAEKAIISSGNEKIAVYGFSGVPEKKAKESLQLWNPHPASEMKNFFMMHQSFTEFLPFNDDMIASLSLSDLPKGFQFIINGHLHWQTLNRLNENQQFVMPGSTIPTQMKKIEAGKQKGFALIDSNSNEISFHFFPNQRELFYEKLKFNSGTPTEILAQTKLLLEKFLHENKSFKKPLIRIKIEGDLASGFKSSDVDLNPLIQQFNSKAILSLDKNFSSTDFKQKLLDLRQTHANKQTISELGIDLLEKSLQKSNFNSVNFDVRQIFELLANDDAEKVVELLRAKK